MAAAFERKAAVTAGVEAAVRLLASLTRGDVLTWAEIERGTGFHRGHTHWGAFVRRLKAASLAAGVCLWATPNVGFRLLTNDEALNWRQRQRQKRAARQLIRDVKELRAVPDKELSTHQRVAKSARIDLSRDALRRVRGAAAKAAILSKPSGSDMPRARLGAKS